jgi:hypothetical protein
VLENEKRIPANSEIIRLIRETGEDPACAPGEAFEYSDVNYMLLANAVEKVSGMKFEEFMKKNVFEPAGMKDSGIYHTRRDGRPSDRFTRNMVLEDDGSYVPSDVSELTAKYVVGSDGMNGCDYLYTTVFDMLAWDRALREEKVLTLEEQGIMYAPMPLTGGGIAGVDDEGYGFGWEFHNEPGLGLVVSHSGGMPGLATWFERFVDADRVIVTMNCRDFADIRAYLGFSQGLENIARDKEPEAFKTIEDIAVKDPDKSQWESFCGKYEHPEDAYFIVDEVWMQDGELWAKAIDDDGDELKFQLYPLSENEFGRKLGMVKIAFSEDSVTVNGGQPCKKL